MKLFIILATLLTGCATRPRSELSVEVRAEQSERPSVVVAYRMEVLP
jgi:hypothetical protein